MTARAARRGEWAKEDNERGLPRGCSGCNFPRMSTVTEILEAVKQLPQDKKDKFLEGL
jgi:hypothetical protein